MVKCYVKKVYKHVCSQCQYEFWLTVVKIHIFLVNIYGAMGAFLQTKNKAALSGPRSQQKAAWLLYGLAYRTTLNSQFHSKGQLETHFLFQTAAAAATLIISLSVTNPKGRTV